MFGALGTAIAKEDPLKLDLPIACDLGTTCFIQNYVDVEPSSAVRDFTCGQASYNGHKGVDFRLPNLAAMANDVAVLAAADGIVLRVRDGVADQIWDPEKSQIGTTSYCGNGVVVEHAGGFETQYCHLKRDSVAVVPGARVTAGTQLGAVGASGAASFPHVHFSVRKEGEVVDPYLGSKGVSGCDPDMQAQRFPMWSDAARAKLNDEAGDIIESAFLGASPVNASDEDALKGRQSVTASSAQLVFAFRGINVVEGDKLAISLEGPEPFKPIRVTISVKKTQARIGRWIGRKRPSFGRFAAGTYIGNVTLTRGGAAISSARQVLELR